MAAATPHHHHAHDHDHTDNAAFTEKNRNHWDSMASSYDAEQWQKDFLNAIHAFLLENIDWIGVDFMDPSSTFEAATTPPKPVRVLDYACGPGTITNILYSHAHEFVGVDLSEKMVAQYNARFSHSMPVDVAPTNAKAVVGNLIDPASATTVPEARHGSFDLVAVGLGFHHFSNLEVATERLAAYLQPRGVFMIVDFLPHAKESTTHTNPAKHTVAHHGFGAGQVSELFGNAGLTDIKIKTGPEVMMRGVEKRTVFVARGSKP